MKLTIDGHEVSAATGGRAFDRSRPAIVFIHGAGMEHTAWVHPARWYAHHGWSVLAPDLPGHGRSAGPTLASVHDMADWIVHLLDAAGVERAVLVGHSMGGAIAIETAARHAGRVCGLGLICTAASIPVGPALMEAARDRPAQAYNMMTTWSHTPAARIGGNPAPGIWMTGFTRRIFDLSRNEVLARDLAACAAWSSGPAAAASISCAALVISAAADMMTPAKNGAALAKLITGSRLIVVPDCGHMILAEAPDACLDALIGQFGSVDT